MTVVVTMAGVGSRFKSKGYEVPKFMIRARARTLFEWSMESLREFYQQPFVFACLSEHDISWIEKQALILGIKNYTVVPRDSISLGQAQTAYDALRFVSLNNDDLWIYNIDTYISRGIHPSDMKGHYGCVHVFNSVDPGMSFVRYDENGEVIELAEKKTISDWATVGMYGFASIDLYRKLYEYAYLENKIPVVAGERYVAPIYQLLIQSGKSVCAPRLNRSEVHILGTPEEVEKFDPLVRPPFGT
jgi:choline kinase